MDVFGETFRQGRLRPVDAEVPIAKASIEVFFTLEDSAGNVEDFETWGDEETYGACMRGKGEILYGWRLDEGRGYLLL